MTLVLDTSVLIGEAPVGLEEQVAVSVVSFAELQYGLLVATDPAERGLRLARLSAIEETFDPLPVTGAVARSYAVLASTIHRTGRRPRSRAPDLLIAATAYAARAGIATRNPGDLDGLDELLRIVVIR